MGETPADVLAQIGDWPVPAAAGAVLDRSGVLAAHGDLKRRFPLASVTKPLVGYGVLVAVMEEAIGLDDPLGPPGATVRHLLAHASGIGFDSDEVQAPVATMRIYSSRGFELLADAVADATDIPFAEYLHEAVFEPLGMTGTALTGPAGHGAVSTVADLTRFAAELLSPRLLPQETLDAATTVQFPGLAGFVPGYGRFRENDWGLAFELHGAKSPHWAGTSAGPRVAGHFGQSGTFLWFDAAAGQAAVVLTDRAFGPWAKPLWQDFNDALRASLT